jgi:muramidase (phage lysozyme)
MAKSRIPGPEGLDYDFSGVLPSRTPGPLGYNDAADPSVRAYLGDTPGPTGFNDAWDPSLRRREDNAKGKVISPISKPLFLSPLKDKQKAINVKAFLKLLRYAENKPRDDDGVYYVLYGGKKTFTDTSVHPVKKRIDRGEKPPENSPAGAYQIVYGSWVEANKKKAESGVSDFTPESQDNYAIWKLHSRKAYKYVEAGDIESAITKTTLPHEWSSLPGGVDQHLTMSEVKERFEKYRKEFSQP